MHSILHSINWRGGGVMHYFLDFSRLVSCGYRVGVRGFCLFSVSFDIFLSASQSSTSSLVPNLHLYLHAVAMLCDSFDLENKRNLTAEIHRAAQLSRPCFLFPLAHCGTVYWKFHSWERKHALRRVTNLHAFEPSHCQRCINGLNTVSVILSITTLKHVVVKSFLTFR